MLVPALALLLMAPTGVQAAADDLVVCDAPPEGTTVIGPNHSSTPEVASPQSFDDVTDLNYQLDLYPAKATNKATISSSIGWQISANDFDLFLLDADGEEITKSEGVQPLDPNLESVGGTLLHCSLFTIRVLNYQAIGGGVVDMVDPFQTTLTTGSVK
jgi:hypothetical protein